LAEQDDKGEMNFQNPIGIRNYTDCTIETMIVDGVAAYEGLRNYWATWFTSCSCFSALSRSLSDVVDFFAS